PFHQRQAVQKMLSQHFFKLCDRRQVHKRIPLRQKVIILKKLSFLLPGKLNPQCLQSVSENGKISFTHLFSPPARRGNFPGKPAAPIRPPERHQKFWMPVRYSSDGKLSVSASPQSEDSAPDRNQDSQGSSSFPFS